MMVAGRQLFKRLLLSEGVEAGEQVEGEMEMHGSSETGMMEEEIMQVEHMGEEHEEHAEDGTNSTVHPNQTQIIEKKVVTNQVLRGGRSCCI